MKLLKKFKIILVAITIYYIYCNHLLSSDYKDIINKVFSDRKLDNLEGIWVKTIANQGPPGCVTMFYKDQDKYFQIHIDECFVMGKITGRQKKTSSKPWCLIINQSFINFGFLHHSILIPQKFLYTQTPDRPPVGQLC